MMVVLQHPSLRAEIGAAPAIAEADDGDAAGAPDDAEVLDHGLADHEDDDHKVNIDDLNDEPSPTRRAFTPGGPRGWRDHARPILDRFGYQ